MCELLLSSLMDVHTWYHVLVEVRHTHVRDDKVIAHTLLEYTTCQILFSPPQKMSQAPETLNFAPGATCDMCGVEKGGSRANH